MEPLGILLYGYSENDSKKIKKILEELMKDPIILISGSKKENVKVLDILEYGPDDNYEDKENKILLFLGFNDEQIDKVLQNFPDNIENEIQRPIFCGLTQENVNWTLEYLVEHLLEEDKYWKSKKNNYEDN